LSSAVRSTFFLGTRLSSTAVKGALEIEIYQSRILPRAMLRVVDSVAARSFSSIQNPMGPTHWAAPQLKMRRNAMNGLVEFIVNVIVFILQ
jgi:hypothetical protein